MKDDIEAVIEMGRSAVCARFRILKTESEERPDGSWQTINATSTARM